MYWLEAHDPVGFFPPADTAAQEPDGLLAAGGDLNPLRLLAAYQQGIFPWYNAGEPILWWNPSKRTLLTPNSVHISRSLRRVIKRKNYRISLDQAFDQVILACASPRQNQPGTWITEEMIAAYQTLHKMGFAHSIEIWRDQQLIGGLYGISLGQAFFGESMFNRAPNGSKLALVHLCRLLNQLRFHFIDCQMPSDHLLSMGAHTISRSEFLHRLNQALTFTDHQYSWSKHMNLVAEYDTD